MNKSLYNTAQAFELIKHAVKDIPNDKDLGAEIRKIVNEQKQVIWKARQEETAVK